MAPFRTGLSYTHKLIMDSIQSTGKAMNYDDIVKALKNKHHMISELAISKAMDYLVNNEFIGSDIIFNKKVYKVLDKGNQALEYCRICNGSTYSLDEETKVCNVCLKKILSWPELPLVGCQDMLETFISDVTPGVVFEARKLSKEISNLNVQWNY